MAPPTCLLAVALLLLCVSPFLASSQSYDNRQAADYTCPPGFLPIALNGADNSPIMCDTDQCLNAADGCSPGNVCTQAAVQTVLGGQYQHQCQCNPPYVKGFYFGMKSFGAHTSCFIPGLDLCNPNPCQNGGQCALQNGSRADISLSGPDTPIDFTCTCRSGFAAKTCDLVLPNGLFPSPVRKSATAPPPSGSQGVCGTGSAAGFPTRCYFNSDPQGRYVCCDSAGCNGFAPPDFSFPRCAANGFAPPGFGVESSSTPPANPAPSPPPPSGDQGVCGTGTAASFPTRCFFNSDPQGRYVCCDGEGCNGFNSDNLTPHCKNYGYVPPNFGVGTTATSPPAGPPTGSQGVCGIGGATGFPVRCYYNNDPQGRYVCCDSDGCNGFNPPDFFFPHCKTNGYVPTTL